ncbi:virB8 family protein [Stenotrophomonas koreensis]|nr:type IV secretion system protein [Stenotrophomonas koreensis]
MNYEVTVADLARRSQKRAWWVAGVSLAVTLILAGAIFMMLPLKEREPYLVVLDPVTGNAQVSRLVASAADGRLYADQAVARSNIHRFVVARESYDYDLMMTSQSGDWKLPFLMSTGSVSAEMRALWGQGNPANPSILYGKDRAVRIRILSIVLERVGGPRREGAATVRFQRVLFDKKSGGSRVIDNKVAMIEFEYNPNLRLSDADRVQNPLGFQVKTYRVDNDAALTTPGEVELAPVPATTLPDLSVATGQPAVSGAEGAALPATGAVDPLQIQQLQLQLQLLQQQQLQQGQLQQGQEQVATPGAMGSLPPPNGDVAR